MQKLKEVNAILNKTFGKDAIIEIVDKPLTKFCLQNFCFAKVVKGSDEVNVAVKTLATPGSRIYFSDCFRNESLWYSEILPNLSKEIQTLFPKCYYATPYENIGPEGEIAIVFEDIEVSGFRDAPKRELSNEEFMFAVEKLGQFHAEVLSFKLKDPVHYDELTRKIKVNFTLTNDGSAAFAFGIRINELYCILVLERFIERHGTKLDLVKKASRIISRIRDAGIEKIVLENGKINDDKSLLVHGDFISTNFVFKYDVNRKINDIRIFDFQKIMPSSPVIDLSFLMYYNTESTEQLKAMWNEIWNTYYNAFTKSIKLHMGNNFEVPSQWSKKSLMQDFKKYSLQSYLSTSFFYPMVRAIGSPMLIEFGRYMAEREVRRLAGKLNEDFEEEFIRESFVKYEDENAIDFIDELTENFLEIYEDD